MKRRYNTLKSTLVLVLTVLLFSSFVSGDEKCGVFCLIGKGVGMGLGLLADIVEYAGGLAMDILRFLAELTLDGMSLNPNIYDWGTGKLTGAYVDITRLAMLIVIPIYMGVIIMAGMYLIFVSMDYRRRAHAKQYITRLFFGLVLVTFAPMIYQMILDIEKAMVDSIFTTAFPTMSWDAAMNGLILLIMVIFFPHFLCTVGVVAILMVLLAALMVYVRYLVVAILGAFFPITIFLYMWDFTKKLGATMIRWTLIWVSIPIVQTLFYVVFLSLLADFQGALGAILAVVCFSMIVISPLIMTTLMSAMGSYVNAAGGYWGSPTMIAVGHIMMGGGPWSLEAAGSFTGFRKAGFDEYQGTRPEVARPGGDTPKPAAWGFRSLVRGSRQKGGGKFFKGLRDGGLGGAVDSFVHGGRMGPTSTQQRRGFMESLTDVTKQSILTAVQPIGKVFTAAGAKETYVLPPFLKGYARHMGRALGAGIDKDAAGNYSEWGVLFPQISRDRDWKLAKGEVDDRARERHETKQAKRAETGKREKEYNGPSSVSVFGTYMRRKIAQAPTSMLASHAGLSLALLTPVPVWGAGIGILAAYGLSKTVKSRDKKQRAERIRKEGAAAKRPKPARGSGGKPGEEPDTGRPDGEESAGGAPDGTAPTPTKAGQKALADYSRLKADVDMSVVAEAIINRGNAYDYEVAPTKFSQSALRSHEKVRKLEVLEAERRDRQDKLQSHIAYVEANTGNPKRDIERAMERGGGLESAKRMLNIGDEYDDRLSGIFDETERVNEISGEIHRLRNEEIENPFGEDSGVGKAGDAFDTLQAIDELVGPGQPDEIKGYLDELKGEGDYGVMLANAKENGFSSIVDFERWADASFRIEESLKDMDPDVRSKLSFDQQLKRATQYTGDRTLASRYRELDSKRNGMLSEYTRNKYRVDVHGKKAGREAEKRLQEMSFKGMQSRRKAFNIYDDIMKGVYAPNKRSRGPEADPAAVLKRMQKLSGSKREDYWKKYADDLVNMKVKLMDGTEGLMTGVGSSVGSYKVLTKTGLEQDVNVDDIKNLTSSEDEREEEGGETEVKPKEGTEKTETLEPKKPKRRKE